MPLLSLVSFLLTSFPVFLAATSSRHVQLRRPWRIIPAQPSPHLLPLPPSLLLSLNLLLLPFILHLSLSISLSLISPSWFFFFCVLEMKVSARLHSSRWMSPNEEGLGRTPHPFTPLHKHKLTHFASGSEARSGGCTHWIRVWGGVLGLVRHLSAWLGC